VASATSLTSGVAGRYATAVFEIAKDEKSLDRVEADIDTLSAALEESQDLRDLIGSPVYTRDEQGRAIGALSDRLGLGPELTNTLGLLAQKRRLFVLPALIAQLRALIAADRGEVEAEIISARPLSDAQSEALARTLRDSVGSDVRLNTRVDESLIGGLVVKVGSRMIDTSIRAKLASLQNVMKEVG
jgi:F-type H+-transporting ATPase subunit delta